MSESRNGVPPLSLDTRREAASTVLDALIASVRAAGAYNRDDAARPAAILWPDKERQWEKLLPMLRARLPEMLVLGNYAPHDRTGPGIWLRCVLAGKVEAASRRLSEEISGETSLPPWIIYMPGWGRGTLRATDECPPELKPLAELQYRGTVWSPHVDRDWTLTTFLQSKQVGLTLAKDAATATSLKRAIERLAMMPVSELVGKCANGPLDSDCFDGLISDDPIDDLLSWMSDPAAAKANWDAPRLETLGERSLAEYGFDVEKDGELEAARLLGERGKASWKTVWKRFAASPERYAGVPELLRRAKPQGGLFSGETSEAWPQDNEADEAELRTALLTVTLGKAIHALEARHGKRRDWVWARLGKSPLAKAMEHLTALAHATATALTGATTSDMVEAYVATGWKADAAAMASLASVNRSEDEAAVRAALEAIYVPWLRDAAELFQEKTKRSPLPGRELDRLGEVEAGTCVFFVDALRYDVGQALAEMLKARGASVTLRHHTSALPSVTPTAKPAISPVATKIAGLTPGEEFCPSVAADGKELTTDRFRKLLSGAGYQVLSSTDTGDSSGRAWCETGAIDSAGHNDGAKLARRIPEMLESIVQRIETLLNAGWHEVRVVTDHGWLLLPGGLPKVELPRYLAASRWGRCATVKDTTTTDLPCFGWHWAPSVRIASPSGIGCFTAGNEYNHGGLSLQECVAVQLSIVGKAITPAASIGQAKWSGLRCRVMVTGAPAGCRVDLRDKAADAATSLSGAKPVGKDGAATLLVEDDAREGTTTNCVLLDSAGIVIAKMPVTIGG